MRSSFYVLASDGVAPPGGRPAAGLLEVVRWSDQPYRTCPTGTSPRDARSGDAGEEPDDAPGEGLRLFDIRQMRSGLDDLELRPFDTLVDGLRGGDRRALILGPHNDLGGDGDG